jgi:uncharacterized membrane-anchored protein
MLINHPLREHVVQEMLLRRFPPIVAPAELAQIVRIVDPAERARESAQAAAMPAPGAIEKGAAGRHVAGISENGTAMLWERHNEASTATILSPNGVVDDAAHAWIEGLAGHVVRATRITVIQDEAGAAPIIEAARLARDDLVICHIGRCCLWSDFRIGAEGYGRIIIAANGCAPADLGRIVQRMQELGNYRNLALLGLPMAQQQGARLDQLEARLAELASSIAEGGGQDEALLEALSDLSAALAHISAQTAFRMSATRAYAAIVADRLASLEARPIAGHQSLADFNDRRLIPAVRTCANFSERLETLSGRAARVTALLRTRIETCIERQNRDLLASVERGIGLQIQLQHLVEGLSVLAISYYAIGLIAYLVKGAAKALPGLSAEVVTAVAVIPVTLIITIVIARRRHGLFVRDGDRAA